MSIATFEASLNFLTEGLVLRLLSVGTPDTAFLILAGGAVFQLLRPSGFRFTVGSFDMDLFICGSTDRAARQLYAEVWNIMLCSTLVQSITLTSRAATFHCRTTSGTRFVIQLILRRFNSPGESLLT